MIRLTFTVWEHSWSVHLDSPRWWFRRWPVFWGRHLIVLGPLQLAHWKGEDDD